ncbi:hypothetical protein GWK47_003298 [Chionoecetes opilio]|uniref:Uncharacterized protein n=1 Tax=Chionoecetes opilio TaxID=41210 RepID=A0A8J4Z4U7_CHIOP|nr:hypothetical protein GWK47_003298 [Chionoecetes opilio]
MPNFNGMAKCTLIALRQEGNYRPVDRSVKACFEPPSQGQEQCCFTQPLFLTFTAALTPAPHPDKTPARPSYSKKDACYRVSVSRVRVFDNADCPEPFKDNTSAFEPPSQIETPPPTCHLHPRPHCNRVTGVPALRTQHDKRRSHSSHFCVPIRMFGKEWHRALHVNVII